MRNYSNIFVTLFFGTLLLTSCSWSDDLNEYTDESRSNRLDADQYFWYYDPVLFNDVEHCQVIGRYESADPTVDEYYGHYTNRRCTVYHDTIYLKKRTMLPEYNYFNGSFIIGDNEFRYRIKLN